MARPTLCFGNTSHTLNVSTVPSTLWLPPLTPDRFLGESFSPQRGIRDCWGPFCQDLAAGILLGLNGHRKLPTKPG